MSNDLNGSLKSLPDALRALPQVAPERSAWPALAERLQRDGALPTRAPAPRPSRRFVPAALAAGVALFAVAAILLYRGPQESAPVAATVARATASMSTNAANDANATSTQDDAAQLASLQQHSQALEHWLRETGRSATPLPGPQLAAAAELEDMIAIVDGQLGAAARESELQLWQRRVALLEDLAALRYANYKLAENGIALR